MTETARLRQERIRQSLEKTHRQSLRQSIEEKKRKKKESGLRKKVAKKALAQDPGRNRGKEMEAKLKSFKCVLLSNFEIPCQFIMTSFSNIYGPILLGHFTPP